MSIRILLIDLNNFARYPSIAIGYLSAVLRSGDIEVDVLAPLATGLTGSVREPRAPLWGRLNQEFRYSTAITRNHFVRSIRARFAARYASKLARSKDTIVSEFKGRLDDGFDAVLVSTYLMYRPHCVEIGEICHNNEVPLILGGPYFATEDVAREWIDIPGLTTLVGGEVEPNLCEIVTRVVAGKPVDHLKGIWHYNGSLSLDAPPLRDLDSLPFPDYTSFPWAEYPNKIIPIITGRGCGWGACSFCSDVTSTAGRTFRSRSPDDVLAEIAHQHTRHRGNLFVFTDLKINSNLVMWRALIHRMREAVPGARWVGAVHVGVRGENGLTLSELKQARAAGMVRITTGLESGSQRVLDRMAKGTDVAVTSRFLHDAKVAGISVRTTMIIGYPGEEAADVVQTAVFLEEHRPCLERIQLNRFQIMSGTQFAYNLSRRRDKFPTITELTANHQYAQLQHRYTLSEDVSYRRAISRLLRVVHQINRKQLSPDARDFEGVM